jgi:uncharacterized membrane protein YqhA
MVKLYKVIITIVLLFSFINMLAMLVINVMKGIHAYASLFESQQERPGLEIMEIVDGLLMVLLLMIMNIGFVKLFLPDSKLAKTIDLPWLKINSFSQLKMLLIETILTTLVIIFATNVVKEEGSLQWTDILIPTAVVLLALTVKFVKDKEH